MAFKIFALFALVAVVCADSRYSRPSYHPAPYHPAPAYGGYQQQYADTKPYYKFAYAVKDDYTYNDFGHEESRDGYNTQGSYKVALPDGRTQTVTYTADEYGYNADVHYDGYPRYDNYKAAPSYHQPSYAYAPARYHAHRPAYRHSPY